MTLSSARPKPTPHVSKPITPDCRAVLLHLASSAKLAILPRRHRFAGKRTYSGVDVCSN